MKTEKRKHRKSLCNIRYFLVWLTTIVGSVLVQAQSVIEPTDHNDDIVTEISYDYELTESDYQGLQCYGTLHLTLNIYDNIERLILERTSPHEPEDSSNKFLIRRELPLDRQVALQDYPWRIRFRIWIHYKDGSRKYSDTYNINDYIDEEDLKLLYEASSTIPLQDDKVDITFDNGSLHIKIPSKGCLDIFESSGKMLCSKIIRGSESIDIHDLNISNTYPIIIKLQTAEKTVTKKIHIR